MLGCLALLSASIFEILWVALLGTQSAKKSLTIVVTMLFSMGLSLYLLAFASKTLPIAVAYGIWVSVGILGQALIQHYMFNNSLSQVSWGFVLALTISVIGLIFSQMNQGAYQ